MTWRMTLAVILNLAVAATVVAQGNPTGVIRGQVSDPDGLPLPGVTVTATSPAVQGARTAVSSAHGDFILPFLPPGEYAVAFEIRGFAPLTKTVGVAMAETQPLAVKLALAAMTETLTVSTSSTEVLTTGALGQTFSAARINDLPMGRTLESAVLLAPGVSGNGPSGNILISGALSYEGLYLINGVDVNENLRGQPRQLYVQDAIQETKVSTGNISAEYGRFNGGVVNMITKSGGDEFSGSFRDSMTNDSWRSLRPLGDEKLDKVVPAYEGTFGGPILRQKLWFFTDAYYRKDQRTLTLPYTLLSYPYAQSDKRAEGKLTYAVNRNNTLKASYTMKKIRTTNNTSNGPMDLDSLYSNGTTDTLTAINYTSTLSSHLFFEGQFSRKTMTTEDTGAQFTDFTKGTLMFDRSRGSTRFNSPTFCAVCGSGWHEERNNWDAFGKLVYFLSTDSAGSHSITAGFDNFKESRKVDNYQSGSGYRLYVTKTYIADSPDRTIYPVVDGSSYLQYTPLVEESKGSDIRTYSAFVNDQWRLNEKVSFNIGFRFDANRSKDQGGVKVLSDSQWSPRLGLTYDITGKGRWIVNAGYARYVMGVNGAVVDQGSRGGRTASYSWTYTGPKLNSTCSAPDCQTIADVMPQVWTWFQSIGGTGNTNFRSAPSIPGVTVKVSGDTTAPSADEMTVGLARELGRGSVRVDYAYRKYHDMYGSYIDTNTGTVTDPTGRTYNLEVVENSPDATRRYQALTAAANYQWSALSLGGNYTLSYSKGNNDGENVGSGPIMATINTYPEFRQESWNWPEGYMASDQRHKARLYGTYRVRLSPVLGEVVFGLLQRADSGTPYDIVFSVNPRAYVTNPGYITAPSSVSYYIGGRGALRHDTMYATDLSLNWSKKLHGSAEVFFRGLVTNLFDNQAVMNVDETVASNASPGEYAAASLPAFNPFTETPVEGVNYRYGPKFGQPIRPADYQDPRTFSFSFGVRF